MSDSSAVYIKLVCSSSDAGEHESGNIISPHVLSGEDFVFGQTILRVFEDLFANLAGIQINEGALVIIGRNTHVGGAFVVSHQRQVDGAFVGCNMAGDQSLVLTCDLSGAEECVHLAEGGVCAGEYDEAGGVHSQSVDDHFVHAAGFGAVLVKDGLVEGWVAFVFAGDGEDSGRFAHDDDVLVFENNIEVL